MITKQTIDTDFAFMKASTKLDGDVLNVVLPSKRKAHQSYFTDDRIEDIKKAYACRKVRLLISDDVAAAVKVAEVNDIDVEIVEDADTLLDLYTSLEDSTHMAIDFETDSVDAKNANIISVGVTLLPYEETYYIPIAHTTAKNMSIEAVKEFLSKAAHYYQIPFLVWNLSFERKLLQRLGIEAKYVDVMIHNYLAADYPKMGLKDVALHRLGVFMNKFEDVVGKGKKAIPFADVDVEDAAQYCGSDALYTAQLYKLFKDRYKIGTELSLIDHRAALACCDMESEGVKLDITVRNRLKGHCNRRKERLERLMYAEAGKEFNINSTQQLAEVIYTQLGIEPRKYCFTDKGALSTSALVIQRLIEEGEDSRLLRHLSEYRNITNKILGTYLGMWDQVDEHTGNFHPYFNFVGTATGRLSSNIQQLPKSGLGAQIRAGIIAPEGRKIVAADYSQIEFRIFAHILQNEQLIEMIREGHDIHRATAASIFGKKLEDVTDKERSAAKTIVFGLLYGQRENKTAATLGISIDEAKEFIDRYFSAFPTAKDLIESSIVAAKKKGYAETLFGRRRYLPDLKSGNWFKKSEAERQCFNTVIQGTAADIIRKAMADCNFNLCQDMYPRDAKLILQVHDELVFHVKEEVLESFIQDLEKTMTSVVSFSVPLKVDINYGDNYLDAK